MLAFAITLFLITILEKQYDRGHVLLSELKRLTESLIGRRFN